MNAEEVERVTKRLTLLNRKLEELSLEIAVNKKPIAAGKFPLAWFDGMWKELSSAAREAQKIADYWANTGGDPL